MTVDFRDLARIIIIGVSVYGVLIFMLRMSGKRTLSSWNSFDFIVTVAFGSTLATTLLNEKTTFLQSILAFGLLIFLQFVITFITVRSKSFERLVKAEPTLLFHEGKFLADRLKRQRISEGEVLAAVRNNGYADIRQVTAVVLETNGSFSVIAGDVPPGVYSALRDVK